MGGKGSSDVERDRVEMTFRPSAPLFTRGRGAEEPGRPTRAPTEASLCESFGGGGKGVEIGRRGGVGRGPSEPDAEGGKTFK